MNIPILHRHLEHHRPIVARLRRTGRTDIGVMSVLLVETFFRTVGLRLLELAAWPLIWVLCPTRVATLSVGPGQIQLRHWGRAKSWESLAPSASKVSLVLSWEANYDLARLLTRNAGTTQERAAVYRGEARSYHVACLTYAERWLRTF
jgi:non-ribosomal peptide synthetase component F